MFMVIHVHDHSNLLSFQFLICRGQFTRSVSVRHISLGFQEYILDLKSLKIFIHTSLFCTMYRLIYLSMKNRTKYIRRKLISILFQEGVQILQGGGLESPSTEKSLEYPIQRDCSMSVVSVKLVLYEIFNLVIR